MRQTARITLLSLVLIAGLSQFTNCGNYADPAVFNPTSENVQCFNSSCITPTQSQLAIKANLVNGYVPVSSGLADFNVGGDCNEGGYPSNVIKWELRLQGQPVRNSTMTGANTFCQNGRFSIYVYLGSVNGDPVNRAGLNIGNGPRTSYDLYVWIEGISGGVSQPGQKTNVLLNAVP